MINYKKGSRGFLYYAHNNEAINYVKLAICSALTGKHQLKEFNAMLVTNKDSMKSLGGREMALLESLFDEVIFDDDYNKDSSDNMRVNVNGTQRTRVQPWHNITRMNAYEDSIYEETIMIDVDFLFQDANLEKLWGSISPVMMNKHIIPVVSESDGKNSGWNSSEMIGNFTIPMYWATVVYFNRSSFSKEYFDIISHIKNNYFYYQRLYQVEDNNYRNDYSFSMALSIANGSVPLGKEWEIPYKFVLTTHRDMVHRVSLGKTKIIVDTMNQKSPKQIFNVEKISIHCMNKLGLMEVYEDILKAYHYLDYIENYEEVPNG